MEDLPTQLFCLTLAHSIDDPDTVERLLSEYPDKTEQCIPIALRSILESKDLPPVPFFSTRELRKYLKVLWSSEYHVYKFNTASRNGLVYLVSYLINRGVSTHSLNDALMSASEYGSTDTVKLLLDKGANIHNIDDNPLRTAAYQGHIATVRLLLDRKANVHADNNASIRLAASSDNADMVKVLLDHKADIHFNNDYVLNYTRSNPTGKLAKFLREKRII